MNQEIRDIINEMALYDPCTHITPARLAILFGALLDLADSTELSELTATGCALPKLSGAFTYQGIPAHERAVLHSSEYYIIFCTCHSGTAGNLGEKYIIFKRDGEGNYLYQTTYTSSNVTDWVKRAFNECTATSTYPGLLSAALYKKLDAVYNWAVQQGMTPVNE